MDIGKFFADLSERAYDFAELCRKMSKDELEKPKDPEAWREEFLQKQAAGVRFECLQSTSNWIAPTSEDGHDCEGFPGGCERFGCPGGDKCTSDALANIARNYSADKGTAPLNKAIPHLADRALYWAQRAAGTNEVWQKKDNRLPDRGSLSWEDIPLAAEPGWRPECIYRVKPKTAKHYMALLKTAINEVYPFMAGSPSTIEDHAKMWNITIIGDIVEREVEL